jgi:hypothetical protein
LTPAKNAEPDRPGRSNTLEGQTWQTNSGLMSASGTLRPAMQWLVGSGYLLE